MVGANQRDPLQARSKLAFGREHRLAVVRAFLTSDDPMMDKKAVAAHAGVPDTTTYAELMALVRLGALQQVDDTRSWFSRLDGPFWTWAAELISSVEVPAPRG